MDVVRFGDKNIKQGMVSTTKNQKVFANGKLIATEGDIVTYPSPNPPPTVTGKGSKTVFINGISVNKKFDKDKDGSIRLKGDTKIKVGA